MAKTIEFIVEQPLTLGGATNVVLNWAFNTKDGGFIEVRGSGGPYFLSKYSTRGAAVWMMVVSNTAPGYYISGDSFIEDHDGNVVFTLMSASVPGGDQICRAATNGAIINQVSLGTHESRVVLSGDGFLIGGRTPGFGVPATARFIRLNRDFQSDPHWSVSGPTGSWERESGATLIRFLFPHRDGSIVFAGNCNLKRLTKVDTNGNVEWDRKGISNNSPFRQIANDLRTVLKTRDGGFLMAGTDVVVPNESLGIADYDYLLVKISSNGQVMWVRRYGGPRNENLSSVLQTEDGGFLISGSSETEEIAGSKGVGGIGHWLVKTDERGLKQSEFVILNEADWGNYILRTPSGFALVGVNAKQVQPTRWDLTVPRRVKVSAHNPSGLPYRVDVSGDLEHWSPVVIGFSGDLELRENVGATPRYWRAYSTP